MTEGTPAQRREKKGGVPISRPGYLAKNLGGCADRVFWERQKRRRGREIFSKKNKGVATTKGGRKSAT